MHDMGLLRVLLAVFCIGTALPGVSSNTAAESDSRGVLIEYDQEPLTEFRNPDRGWYHHTQTSSSEYDPLFYFVFGGGVSGVGDGENFTLILRHIVLDSFKDRSIDEQTLEMISADFDYIRSAHLKMILRFSYTVELTSPRGDAPKSIVLQHIAQLSPIVNAHSDVILAIQHGFIGTWGEGYYTDYFGDEGTITADQQRDRQEVYDALLSGFSECAMIQVRTWQYKGSLTGSSDPVPPETAHVCGNDSAGANSRTGIHNDCFLASETDFGTWQDSAVDRPRMSEHSLYTIVGGETCNPASNRTACSTALEELSYFHYTYLNDAYHPDILQSWEREGCYDVIEKHLGYRLVLVSSHFPDDPLPRGSSMDFEITVRNDGYAAPMVKRTLKLVFKQENTNVTLDMNGTNINPQFWLGNGTEHVINGHVTLPGDMEPGDWSVFLAITESSPNLQDMFQYNILFVNQPLSAQLTRLNDLQRTASVVNSTNDASCSISYPARVLGGLEGQCPTEEDEYAVLESISEDICARIHDTIEPCRTQGSSSQSTSTTTQSTTGNISL